MRFTSDSLLTKVIRGFGARVGVFGDFMLDEYLLGNVTRISPESPVPVVEHRSRYSTLGGAGNVAMNIRMLGGVPMPFGVIGNDIAGRTIKSALEDEAGICGDYIFVDPTRPTTVKTRIIAQHQQLLRIDSESRAAVGMELRTEMLEALQIQVPTLSALVVSDYDKGVVSRAVFQELLTICEDFAVPVVLDPKAFDLTAVGPVTVITPNEKEAEKFAGFSVESDSGAEAAGRRLLERTGARNILITRGEQGMTLCSADGEVVHMPTQSREVYDVTGAGDTVVAALTLALAAGATITEAAHMANVAAGIVVGKVGTATVSREELQSALGGNWPVMHTGHLRARTQAG